MNDAQLIVEVMNRRGYLVVGSARPMAKGQAVPATHLVADSPHRGPNTKCDSSLTDGNLLYVVAMTDQTDMREQDLLVARLCEQDPPAATKRHRYFYRMRTD